MHQIIVYGSQYGTTKCYANELSNRTAIKAISYDKVKNIDMSKLETIIYLGGLYAGGVKGLKKTISLLPDKYIRIIIVTVGLADVNDNKNINNIRNSIKKQIPQATYERAKIFHLRGGINYGKLNFKHRTMMTLLYNKVRSLPIEEQTAEVKAMIETFNQKVDFIDFNSLEEIIKSI